MFCPYFEVVANTLHVKNSFEKHTKNIKMEVENIGQPRIIEKRLFLSFMKDYEVTLTHGAS